MIEEREELLGKINASGEIVGTLIGAKGAKGDKGDQGIQGETGPAGRDGVDGTNGRDGTDGKDGADGISPIITTSKEGKTTTITIVDAQGTKTATLLDGNDGQNGTNGSDGFSPIANITKSGNTATISITDKNWTTTANVSDGTNGTNGQDGYTPVKGVDYFTQQDIAGLNIPTVRTSASSTSGEVYDVTYINTMLGDIETLLSEV